MMMDLRRVKTKVGLYSSTLGDGFARFQNYNLEEDVCLRTLKADKALPMACRSESASLRPNITRIRCRMAASAAATRSRSFA